MARSKRDLIALGGQYTGVTRLLACLPTRPVLLVLNYHRIGHPDDTPYDPGVFSATAEELDEQVRFLKRRFHLATLPEAAEIAEGKSRMRRAAVLLTFDDGYVDNYTLAFPVLRAHGAQGVFFLPTSFIGAARIPWWDEIAWLVRQARPSVLRLSYPAASEFDLSRRGFRPVLDALLALYKQPATRDGERFLSLLAEACGVPRPDGAPRCFLNWEEAREMLRGGMAVGSHSHSHEVLSRLGEQEQYQDLLLSRQLLEERLGAPVTALAYPVGLPDTFSGATRAALERAGYRLAFSFYGGFNRAGAIERYNIRRHGIGQAARPRFRLQTTLAALTGRFWL